MIVKSDFYHFCGRRVPWRQSAWALGSHTAALDAPARPSVFSWAPTLHVFIYKRESKLGSWATQPPISEDTHENPPFRECHLYQNGCWFSRVGYLLLCILLQPVSFHTSQHPHVPAHNAFRSPWKLLKNTLVFSSRRAHPWPVQGWVSQQFCLET